MKTPFKMGGFPAHTGTSPVKQFIKGHRGQYHRFPKNKGPQYDFTGISKDPKPTSMPKSFNITGSSASDTPGYKDTKMAKVQNIKKIAKKALKVGGRVLGVTGVASTLYGMYKSRQKHSGGKAIKGQKSFMTEAKKKTKSIFKK